MQFVLPKVKSMWRCHGKHYTWNASEKLSFKHCVKPLIAMHPMQYAREEKSLMNSQVCWYIPCITWISITNMSLTSNWAMTVNICFYVRSLDDAHPSIIKYLSQTRLKTGTLVARQYQVALKIDDNLFFQWGGLILHIDAVMGCFPKSNRNTNMLQNQQAQQ